MESYVNLVVPDIFEDVLNKFRNLRPDLESHLSDKSFPPQWLLPKECQYLSSKVYPLEVNDNHEHHLTVTQPIVFDVDVTLTSNAPAITTEAISPPIPLSRANSTESIGNPKPFVRPPSSLNRPGIYNPPMNKQYARAQPPKKIQVLNSEAMKDIYESQQKKTPKHSEDEAKKKLEEKQKAKQVEKQEKQRKKEEERALKKQKMVSHTPPERAMPRDGNQLAPEPFSNLSGIHAPQIQDRFHENPSHPDFEQQMAQTQAQIEHSLAQSVQHQQQEPHQEFNQAPPNLQPVVQHMQAPPSVMGQMSNFPYHPHQMAVLPDAAAQAAAVAAAQFMSQQQPHWNFQPNPLMQAAHESAQHFGAHNPYFNPAMLQMNAQLKQQGLPMHFNPNQIPMANQLSQVSHQPQNQSQQQLQHPQQSHPEQQQEQIQQQLHMAQEESHLELTPALPQFATIFENANMLTPENRALIERFLLGQETRPQPSAPHKVVLSEFLVEEDGQQYKDIIMFEMNFEKGSWRKLKKRKRAR